MENRRYVFTVAYVSLLAFAIVFQSLPPVLRLIMKELGLDHAQGGLLMGLFAFPGIILTIPGGWLADRYGNKRIGAGALVLMIAGTLMVAAAKSFLTLAAGRFVAGVGAMTLIVSAASSISTAFRGPGLGPAMGLYNTGMPVGTILSFNLLGLVGLRLGWRFAVLSSAAVSFIALILVISLRETATEHEPVGLRRSLSAAGGRIWLLGLAWLFFNAAAIAFLTFSPDYFMSLNYKAAVATFLASFLMWGALVVSPAIGPFMNGAGRKEGLIIAGSLLPALIYFGLPALTDWQLPLVVGLGLLAALVPAPLFALPGEIVGRRQQGIAFGVISTCLNVGVLLGPFLVGLSRDATGSYRLGFTMMAVFSALAAVFIVPLFYLRR